MDLPWGWLLLKHGGLRVVGVLQGSPEIKTECHLLCLGLRRSQCLCVILYSSKQLWCQLNSKGKDRVVICNELMARLQCRKILVLGDITLVTLENTFFCILVFLEQVLGMSTINLFED